MQITFSLPEPGECAVAGCPEPARIAGYIPARIALELFDTPSDEALGGFVRSVVAAMREQLTAEGTTVTSDLRLFITWAKCPKHKRSRGPDNGGGG